jgi:hypothetical protein
MTRVQQRRTKGWRKPADAMSVVRGTRWGNPFKVEEFGRADAISRFRVYASAKSRDDPSWLAPLHGRVLMCWCTCDEPCHADVLLELINISER